MFKYLSLIIYLFILGAISRSTKRKQTKFKYLKSQVGNVKVITYLYIVFWLALHILSISSLSTYLNIEDYTYTQLMGVWFLNIMALVVLVGR